MTWPEPPWRAWAPDKIVICLQLVVRFWKHTYSISYYCNLIFMHTFEYKVIIALWKKKQCVPFVCFCKFRYVFTSCLHLACLIYFTCDVVRLIVTNNAYNLKMVFLLLLVYHRWGGRRRSTTTTPAACWRVHLTSGSRLHDSHSKKSTQTKLILSYPSPSKYSLYTLFCALILTGGSSYRDKV